MKTLHGTPAYRNSRKCGGGALCKDKEEEHVKERPLAAWAHVRTQNSARARVSSCPRIKFETVEPVKQGPRQRRRVLPIARAVADTLVHTFSQLSNVP